MSGVRIPPPRPLVVAVAQLVEHRIVTPVVAGSIPVSHPIPLLFSCCCPSRLVALFTVWEALFALAKGHRRAHLYHVGYALRQSMGKDQTGKP